MWKKRNSLIVPALLLGLMISGIALGSTIDRRIDNDDDDAEQFDGGAFRGSTSGDLELAYEDVNQVDHQIVGVRFRDIEIPPGAPILSAYIQFQVDETKAGTEPVNLIIDGELIADANDFVSLPEIESRPRTLAFASWAVPNWTANNQQGPDQRTPDIAAIIQEIVNQPGWVRGNSIVLILSDDPANPSMGVRCAEARDGSASGAPLLHIEYLAGQASQPLPTDGEIIAQASVALSWMPGDYAQASRVYFGDNRADVEAGTGDTDKGLVYWMGYPVSGLDAATTYYWRVDEVNDANPDSPWIGELWSFTTMPANAANPNPAEGDINLRSDVTLSWDPGMNVVFHTIYIGTDPDEALNSTTPTFYTVGASWQPLGLIENEKTYYWRIDTHDTSGDTHKGAVWSFSTMPNIPISDPNLIGWWTFEETGSSALDYSGHENIGTFVGDPQRVPGPQGNALELDGDDFMRIDEVADDFTGSDITLSAWVKTTTAASDWYSCNTSDGSNNVLLFAIVGGQAAVLDADNTYEGRSNAAVNDDRWHMLTYVRQGTTGYIYVDAVLENTHDADFDLSPDDRWSVGQEWDGSTNPTEFLTGLIDDVRLYNRPLTKLEVMRLMRTDLDAAWNPSPHRGAVLRIDEFSQLTWSPGDNATMHDVYFGTDRDAVTSADITTPLAVYQGRRILTTFNPGPLELGQTYYWRIDQFNAISGITKGALWYFTLEDYMVVDDFENYVAWGMPGYHIFEVWRDGVGNCDPGNGNDTGSAANEDPNTVLQGVQAMKYDYDNDGMAYSPCDNIQTPRDLYSRIEAQLAALPSEIGFDWTAAGVKALVLNFHGQTGNAMTELESLWVQLQDGAGYGAKVFYGGFPGESPSDVNEESWRQWNVDLVNFEVDLTDVVSIVIGIGDEGSAVPGGNGTLYFDDIRLYIPRFLPERASPRPADYVFDGIIDYLDLRIMLEDWLMTDYVEATLVASYDLNGNADDGSGHGFHGTLVNAPAFVAGVGNLGLALDCDGGNQFIRTDANAVDMGIDGRAARTITAWVLVRSFNSAAVYEMGTNADGREFALRVRSSTGQWRAQYGGAVHHTITDLDTRGTWVHFAQVYTGGYSHVYVNGGPTSSMAVRLDTDTGKNFRIARWNNNYFDGLIDNVRIYNKALSQTEIVAVMAGNVTIRSGYHPVESPMNLVDPEPLGSRAVNFADFAALIDQWAEKHFWP